MIGLTSTRPGGVVEVVVNEIGAIGLAYVCAIEPVMVRTGDSLETPHSLFSMRKAFEGTFIAVGGYGRDDGNEAMEGGYADLVAYGRLFLANPDLPRRFKSNALLNKHDRNTFYTQDPVYRYTDYPFLKVPGKNPISIHGSDSVFVGNELGLTY